MNRSAILKISSATGNGLGTGFVIDRDKEGVFVATCGHVVNSCAGEILVDNKEATLVKNHYDEGLDIAILYLKGIDVEPLSVAYDTQAKKVSVDGFTYFGDGIKQEKMSHIEAKHSVDIEKANRKIEILRLTPKEKISNGYSGSPAICEVSGKVVGIVVIEMKNESHTNYAISVKHLLEVYHLPIQAEAPSPLFVTEVFDTLNSNRLVVLFSQDFTDITENQNQLKLTFKKKFGEGFFHFSVPSFMDDGEAYFQALSKSCGLETSINTPHSWKVAMQEKLKSSPKRVMLFITDIEDGSMELDKQFSRIVHSLKNDFKNFSALFIGRKKLASLVYKDSDLSPLNTAKEIFFPDVILENIDRELITRQFLSLGKYRDSICKYLIKETLGIHKVWSYTESINALFWKNLLVKKGKNFAWRDELTKQIGREVFECSEDVV